MMFWTKDESRGKEGVRDRVEDASLFYEKYHVSHNFSFFADPSSNHFFSVQTEPCNQDLSIGIFKISYFLVTSKLLILILYDVFFNVKFQANCLCKKITIIIGLRRIKYLTYDKILTGSFRPMIVSYHRSNILTGSFRPMIRY